MTDTSTTNSTSTTTNPTSSSPTAEDLRKLKRTSYLLSYLQKSELFASQNGEKDIPKFLSFPNDVTDLNVSLSRGSSLRSSISDEGEREYRFENEAYNRSIRNNNNGNDYQNGEREYDETEDWDEDGDEDGEESEVDPDDLTNLPYKSPAVYQLPGSGNGNKFRTLVRDGPVGSVLGESERFVVIGKRSFRGAGLWPGELVEVDVEMGGVTEEEEEGEEEYDEEEIGFEGEVEVMWSDDGEEFWLVRDPAEDGSIGKETSWVCKDWFVSRSKKLSRGQVKDNGKQKIELRVSMEED
ncbi:hypothetical protein ABW20_dc0107281 [Dactylellina cionopaga]|nr:hypothetical protein ABW20_dc0107281 [Dactylellina cionopaga]